MIPGTAADVGKIITFKIGDLHANETDTWVPGGHVDASLALTASTPAAVGGQAQFLVDDSSSSAGAIAVLAGGLASAVALIGIGGWYARRRSGLMKRP